MHPIKDFKISNKLIGKNTSVFVIAEIGLNHNGDFNLAKKLIDLASNSGADCVKFQMRNMSDLYLSKGEKDISADLSTQYTLDLLKKSHLSNDQYFKLFDYCKKNNVIPLCTPWDMKSVDALESYGMDAYKVASADFTNHKLLEKLSTTNKPLICSTGMSTEDEIGLSASFLKKKEVSFALLHCNSTYPTPFKDINLNYLESLKKYDVQVGYSGHERGFSVPLAAVALGATIIEKHFTVDKNMYGNDHKVSLLPDEFSEMVIGIRNIEESLGTNENRKISQGEMINRENLSKSVFVNKDIKIDEVFSIDNLEVRSPGSGLKPYKINLILGKKSNRDIKKGSMLFDSDLEVSMKQISQYKFKRPFGIPVRYHDFDDLKNITNIDFVEFHFSYQDLNLNPSDFIKDTNNLDFIVHSPDHFSGDHILDFANKDKKYIERSISELNKVCDRTRELKKIFSKIEKPMIVVNIGGFSNNNFINIDSKKELYEDVYDNLKKINDDDVEIILQTMPPYPWYFGGQRYTNLFCDPKEIEFFCNKFNYRICYDLSHTMMACNYHNQDLLSSLTSLSKFIAHMHISDAKGVDEEGVFVGEGDVDFTTFGNYINNQIPLIGFIPEIWQGHKNSGEGFWNALSFLQKFIS